LKLLQELDTMIAPVIVADVGNDIDINVKLAQGPCDIRIIWGGDVTINEIRKAPVKPWARELTFHDRRSIAVLDTKTVTQDSISRVLKDIIWMQQASCTSVRGIVWCGTDPHPSSHIQQLVVPVQFAAIDRLTYLQSELISHKHQVMGNYDTLVHVMCDIKEFENMVCSCTIPGIVYHTNVLTVDEIPVFANRALQTIVVNSAVDGNLQYALFNRAYNERFCDRIISLGKSMSFSWTWDGYDLISSLTHRVSFEG
jgi:hypothetical protein